MEHFVHRYIYAYQRQRNRYKIFFQFHKRVNGTTSGTTARRLRTSLRPWGNKKPMRRRSEVEIEETWSGLPAESWMKWQTKRARKPAAAAAVSRPSGTSLCHFFLLSLRETDSHRSQSGQCRTRYITYNDRWIQEQKNENLFTNFFF